MHVATSQLMANRLAASMRSKCSIKIQIKTICSPKSVPSADSHGIKIWNQKTKSRNRAVDLARDANVASNRLKCITPVAQDLYQRLLHHLMVKSIWTPLQCFVL